MCGPMCPWCGKIGVDVRTNVSLMQDKKGSNCRNLMRVCVCVLMSSWYCTWDLCLSWSRRRRVWTTSWDTSWRQLDCVSAACRRPPVLPWSTARPGTRVLGPWTCTPCQVLCECVALATYRMTTRYQRTPVTAAVETHLYQRCISSSAVERCWSS